MSSGIDATTEQDGLQSSVAVEEAPGTFEPSHDAILSHDSLIRQARQLAQRAQSEHAVRPAPLHKRVAEAARDLESTRRELIETQQLGEPTTRDADWLLDNFYVIEAQLRQIKEDLPDTYLAELPRRANGLPRVHELATALIRHTDGLIDRSTIAEFVNAYQSVTPLSMGEVWSIPIMLRVALLEALVSCARVLRMTRSLTQRARGILQEHIQRPVSAKLDLPDDPSLVVHLLLTLDHLRHEDPQRFAGLEHELQERFPDLPERQREQHRRQAANQVAIGNLITGMRLMEALDWLSFFQEASLVERRLREDPSGVYAEMDDDTRDRYRHAVEDLSRWSRKTELAVVDRVMQLARESISTVEPGRHPGYWLIDDGREALERMLGCRRPLSRQLVAWCLRYGHGVYFGSISALTIALTVSMLLTPPLPLWAGLLILIPLLLVASDLAVGLVNYAVTRLVPPRVLPKLEFRNGLTAKERTMIIVPALLTRPEDVDSLLSRLELHYVANIDPELRFALLTDFRDADSETLPGDEPLLASAILGIQRLNGRYRGSGQEPFYLFHRRRLWNPREGRWMGWERKRGKLAEFHRLLRGDGTTSYATQIGDLSALGLTGEQPGIRYLITCDADTQLPYGAAHKLIGTLAHPLNRVVLDRTKTRVERGYTLIQPRISVPLTDGNQSPYATLFSNSRGTDPYGTAASDVYQDLFGEGSFTGKGIYDLDAFDAILEGAFGENQILSHDLIEGCFVRTALASDIEMLDGFPTRYDADVRRHHRWVRGDWQISPWLFSRVPSAAGQVPNRLSWLSRWKIADNLRRSLVLASLMVLLVLGSAVAPAHAWIWSLLALACLGLPTLITLFGSLEAVVRSRDLRTAAICGIRSLGRSVAQWAVLVMSLPHRAWVMSDAVVRSIWRMKVSRRHLLEWETAANAELRLQSRGLGLALQLATLPALAVLLTLLLPRPALPAILVWLVGWCLAPLVLPAISRRRVTRTTGFSPESRVWLRQLARRSWHYFEVNIGPENHWLPPDNVQEYPSLKVAQRLSPTNEGLFLLSGLCAKEFGYIGLPALVALWEKNLATLDQLPRLRGHFLNWYDATTLEPLRPAYISTVDSGNLAASFIAMRQGLDEALSRKVLEPVFWDGLRDTLLQMEEVDPRHLVSVAEKHDGALEKTLLQQLKVVCHSVDDCEQDWLRSITHLQAIHAALLANRASITATVDKAAAPGVDALAALIGQQIEDFKTLYGWLELWKELSRDAKTSHAGAWWRSEAWTRGWVDLAHALRTDLTWNQLVALAADVEVPLATLINPLSTHPTDNQALAIKTQLERLQRAVIRSSTAANAFCQRVRSIRKTLDRYVQEMDFQFLYDPIRRLFVIGFNVDEGRADGSHYDLLCSEARLTSYLAIAKGDVPVRHWFRLGRQPTTTAGRIGLLSWGGTMFEYLMPCLFQRTVDGSLLQMACVSAVNRQISYGRERAVPWGVSESAYGSLANNTDYQYQSFGVPGLGLKRGLNKDLVIAPYATMLALDFAPAEAVENLRRLDQLSLLAGWGFYEAADFTPTRIPAGRSFVPVRCFMAHHQGMSFLAMANALLDGPVRRWFHADPQMQAAELLLEEQVPTSSPTVVPHVDEVGETPSIARIEQQAVSRRIATYDTSTPRAHVLSNGSYSVMMTNSGAGYSQWNQVAVARWRPDVTRDCWGQWIYMQDVARGVTWSAGYQPTCVRPDAYEVVYSIDKATLSRRDGEIESQLEVVICPECPVEIRQLTLLNHGQRDVVLQLTSFQEVVLTSAAADLAHPAFQKLFVETELYHPLSALFARRRPRQESEAEVWGFHALSADPEVLATCEYETDRRAFLGRDGTLSQPLAIRSGQQLTGTTGAVLDPIFAIRCRVRIPAQGSVQVTFLTGAGSSRDQVLRLAELYHDHRMIQRAAELAWASTQVDLHQWHISPALAQKFQRLLSCLLFPERDSRSLANQTPQDSFSQSQLWGWGISGDHPLLVARVTQRSQLSFIRELAVARQYWLSCGVTIDLVLLNGLAGSYVDELHEQLQQLIRETPHRTTGNAGGIFLLRGAQLSDRERQLIQTAATMFMDAGRGWSNPVLQSIPAPPAETRINPKAVKWLMRGDGSPKVPDATRSKLTVDQSRQLDFWNGWGGFADQGRRYLIQRDDGKPTPLPWSNVLANPRAGCLLTEAGGGYTWVGNSREFKLTTWSNDPVLDTVSEQLFLQNLETGRGWAAFGHQTAAAATRRVEHGAGWSRWSMVCDDIELRITIAMAVDDPVKLIGLELTNHSARSVTLRLTYFSELVLGVCREQTQLVVATQLDRETGAILARNRFHAEFAEQLCFLHAPGPQTRVSGSRTEVLGRFGTTEQARGLLGSRLSNECGLGFDPGMASQFELQLGPEESTQAAFLFGAGAEITETRALLTRYDSVDKVWRELLQSQQTWLRTLSSVQVETPDPAVNHLLNQWLPYQALSCRIWGRSAFYQSGGAYGFRDQLQDVLAIVYHRPDVARDHLLRAAAHQFEEGDVQHWWHPPAGRGTRTRFSDDLLWFIVAVCQYVRVTGDESVWEQAVSYLQSAPLEEGEQERYDLPDISRQSGTLYDHASRALARGFRTGEHGLPLIGCGDWNDGLSNVGVEGRGESVWMGWFLLYVMDEFLPWMRRRGDGDLADQYETRANSLREAIEATAWDGHWYRRAYFDDGTPLGSSDRDECRIDSLAQSWSVIAGGDVDRQRVAMESSWTMLVEPHSTVVPLLLPPFRNSHPNPGYIQGYLPGVRENGGQYTHAVTWMVQAWLRLGEAGRAWELLERINPIHLTSREAGVALYQVEPYVIAADVYSQSPHEGRGGWTWYTGSAAWLYRVILEDALGVRVQGNRVTFAPCVPPDWKEFRVTLRRGTARWQITVKLTADESDAEVAADSEGAIELIDDGKDHEVTCRCRRRKPSEVVPPETSKLRPVDADHARTSEVAAR